MVSMVRSYNCFASNRRFGKFDEILLIISERTKTFRHQWFGDIDVLPRFHGDPSWKNICKGVWTSEFDWKEV